MLLMLLEGCRRGWVDVSGSSVESTDENWDELSQLGGVDMSDAGGLSGMPGCIALCEYAAVSKNQETRVSRAEEAMLAERKETFDVRCCG